MSSRHLELVSVQQQQMQLMTKAIDGNAHYVEDVVRMLETIGSQLTAMQPTGGGTGRFMPPTRRREP